MSFPPTLPNNPLFRPAYAGAPVPGLPRFSIPMGGLPLPLAPLSMGVTVPAGVTSISAPPVRNQNSAIIAAPPVLVPGAPMIFPPNTLLSKVNAVSTDSTKKLAITTVFVGNITDKASDMLIRHLLSKCGTVHNWKRIQGPDGKLQAFGFCDYADPESAMRAIRLLHNFQIADKKLIVKVDAKNQEKLDEYSKCKNSDENKNETLDEEDKIINGQLLIVLKEHEIELLKEPDSKNIKRFSAPKDVKNEKLTELEMEDDKRNLITREIDKFRDTYKKYDEEKEEEKRKKEQNRSSRRSDRRRSRSRDKDDRSLSRRSRDRRFNRERRSSSYEDILERERSKSPINHEEKLIEQRKKDQIDEREICYQRHLRDWEAREKRKTKEYLRERQKEVRRKEEEEKEKKKLKQFLQDYDDYKHDEKYYSGKSFEKRLSERRKEMQQDKYERDMERKELEELKRKLNQEGHPDPESAAQKHFNIDSSNDANKLFDDRSNNLLNMDDDSQGSTSNNGQSVKTFGFAGMKLAGLQNSENISNGSTNATNFTEGNENRHLSKNDLKRKKLTVSEVFNANEDDDLNSMAKKRRPPPNALLEDSNTDSNLSNTSNKNLQLSQEEKKIQIKKLIDKIPTSKNELFTYVLDWELLDDNLMERRIRPWISKKIRDYIGEEEETLIEFICKKLLSKSPAQSLLDDVAMVLDEEAQVFVVKLWRLLIYEIEAKKLGLTKY